MFDIDEYMRKYVEDYLCLDFQRKPDTDRWQCVAWDNDVKIVFVPDKISVQQGTVTDRAKSWWCVTTRVIFYSKDKKFYLIGVQLIRPAD